MPRPCAEALPPWSGCVHAVAMDARGAHCRPGRAVEADALIDVEGGLLGTTAERADFGPPDGSDTNTAAAGQVPAAAVSMLRTKRPRGYSIGEFRYSGGMGLVGVS